MKTRPEAPPFDPETEDTGRYTIGELQKLLSSLPPPPGVAEVAPDPFPSLPPPGVAEVAPDPFPSQPPTRREGRTAWELLAELDSPSTPPSVEVVSEREPLQLPLSDGSVIILDDDGEY